MKISRAWLQTYFNAEIPSADQLADLFTFHAFEVEGQEKFGADDVLDVKVLPDRAHYALSHRGIASEVAVLTKQALRMDRLGAAPLESLTDRPVVEVAAAQFCRRYMARLVDLGTNAGGDSTTTWFAPMLQAIGERLISPVVDAANFVMFDMGQPLHAFDADKVVGPIRVRTAAAGEKITLLDGRELTLTPADHVIADDLGPLVVAGAKGGKRAEIGPETKRLIIEAANFEPATVRRTSNKYDIRSESSRRFENEITPKMAERGMAAVSALLQSLYPTAKFGPITDIYADPVTPALLDFAPAYLAERLGIIVPLDEAKDILTRMNIKVSEKSPTLWQLTIPCNRLDLKLSEDIVEEIGRIYGYDHIEGVLPPAAKLPSPQPMFYLSETIKNLLTGQGFAEVNLYTLVAKGQIETAYPLSRDKAFARANLADGLVVALARNVSNADLLGLSTIRLFEIGHVFSAAGESAHLAMGIAQAKKVKGLTAADMLKQDLASLGQALGVTLPEPTLVTNGLSTVAEISLDEVLKNYKLPQSASYLDLHFGPATTARYKRYSAFPFIVRDIAVFVPSNLASDAVWRVIAGGVDEAEATTLLAKHYQFDEFKKGDKTSLAFRLVFQAADRTLTDIEVNEVMNKVYEVVRAQGWEVR